MNESTPTAQARKPDLAAHTPMMAQYLGVTSFANGYKELLPAVNFTVPF